MGACCVVLNGQPLLISNGAAEFSKRTQIAKFMGSTWGPPGSCRPQMGPMLTPWTLLSGKYIEIYPNSMLNWDGICPLVLSCKNRFVKLCVTYLSRSNKTWPFQFLPKKVGRVLRSFILRRFTVVILSHYNDVLMTTVASQITSLTIVYSTVYSGAVQREHQSSASLAFVRGIHRWQVNSPHKGPVTRKMFPFDDVIMSGHVTYFLGIFQKQIRARWIELKIYIEIYVLVDDKYNEIS